ncbi:general secretion pathway protein D [Pseudoduganella flava]|uniref:General secretion pathway protein D n=1 Tax=Pseudoduganella flava TaxID=871742 RepID=A0A562PNW6_9BURK|nr:type II secretion system secretin GspD [Pseudoduganella flava]QGZ40691.1 type II secretion system secretin GspD [Pseudoduganella flava]TWI46145.1 general secretion pathway protein D [Pseudoduganella flava]
MKTASHSKLPALRRLSAAALLCCVLSSSIGPAWAAPAPQDEAALNFVGADIEAVIKAVGHYTNITFLIDPRVKGTITLVSEKAITKSQAFALLTSALRLQGYAIVSGDGYAKVVPEAEAKLQATPTVVKGQATPKGDQVATQVFQLNHESAANLVTVLRPLISTNNTINANPGNNTLVITDYADNLKRLAKIIAAMDTPATADIDVVPVQYGIASDLATIVNKLMEPGSGGDGGGRVSVMADPRTNSLVLRAPSAARAALAKSLIAKLDQPTTQAGNVHVVYLKNADATKLAETLRAVITGEAPSTSSTGTANNQFGNQGNQSSLGNSFSGSNTNSASTTNGPTNPALQANRSGSQSTTGAGGFIQADPSTNTLIITAPDAVYRNLRAVIDQLDVRRAQVYIEALIVEVSADKASDFGVQWVAASGDSNSTYRIGGLQSFSSGGNNLVNVYNGTSAPSNGLTIGIFKQLADGKYGLGAVAHTLETNGNGNILSTPNMITLDNEVATIRVGQNVPILTGQYTTSSGTTTSPFQTIDRKDVGLILKVKPQISEGGTIKLAIYNESSSVAASSVNATQGITLNTRVIENNVIADDGQIIVLGGLIEDTGSDNVEKVRGLGDIPVIGNLFKYNTRSRKKTNLMVFLRPVVIRSKEQSQSLAADRYDYMRAAGATLEQDKSPLVRNLGNPELPALVNGIPTGSPALAKPVPPAPVPERTPGAAEPQPKQ